MPNRAPDPPRHRRLPHSAAARRRRRRHLLVPLVVVVAAGTAGVGALAFFGRGSDQMEVARSWAQAYVSADYERLYELVSSDDRARLTDSRFAALQESARDTATVTQMRAGTPRRMDDVVQIPVTVDTRLFGLIRGNLDLAFVQDVDGPAVEWSSRLAFPGLRRGERLRREIEMPERADILAADGSTIVSGSDRTRTDDAAVASIVGDLGVPPDDRREELDAEALPDDAEVGLSGLERVLELRVRGTPGGRLYAGDRLLARRAPQAASAVRTTIKPDVQRAAVSALGDRLGGIAAVDPRTGGVLALAGAAFSGLQPPGSTFKIITATAGLRYDLTKLSKVYPVETSTTLSGVELQNADGESCGGTLRNAFAHSCNSVFAPLGAKVGAERLVRTAEDFGFNAPLGVPGAAVSTIPSAEELGDDALNLGSTAIGQGRVQASALQMALVAATIAEDGERPALTFIRGASRDREQVIPGQVATGVQKMMRAVVTSGTGTAAAIDGVGVAGKTGTAELRSTQGECDEAAPPPGGCPDESDTTDTTAWFAGYAPTGTPRIAVAVMLPGQGQGGTTAAPAFKTVVESAL